MKFKFAYILITIVLLQACKKDDPVDQAAVYDATPYELVIGDFPEPPLPADNKPTKAGVQLGRMLFYEKSLSKDGTQACADCHQQLDGFSDIRQFSVGVEGHPGKRQAMAIFNLAWHQSGMFWDGRAATVREQSLKPIQDPLEMNETLENVISKLQASKTYRDQFIRAFGSDQITSERMALAMEQFMFTLISNGSKYDKFLAGQAQLTAEEERGRMLFFSEFDPFGTEKGAECFHCHGGFNFTNDQYMNNGLDDDAGITDEGRFKVTNDASDRGRFKVPSLRNIALTPPYMHDGRFATLEAVIDHYNTGVKQSSTVDELMQFNLLPGGLQLTAQDKADLVAFLKTLTDESFINNAKFSTPF